MSTQDASQTDDKAQTEQNRDLFRSCLLNLPFVAVGAFMLWTAAVVIGFDTEADLERMAIANQAAERFSESGSLADAKTVLAIYQEFDADTPWNRTQRRETWALVGNLQSDAARLDSPEALFEVLKVQDPTDQTMNYFKGLVLPESATLTDLNGGNNAQND